MNNIGFVYRWSDSYNGKHYIGSHCGDISDGYIGSGSYFKKAYKKRKECFSREILYIGKDYIELEEFILQELDCKNDINSYNLTNNARGVSMQSEESKRNGKSGNLKTYANPIKSKICFGKLLHAFESFWFSWVQNNRFLPGLPKKNNFTMVES